MKKEYIKPQMVSVAINVGRMIMTSNLESNGTTTNGNASDNTFNGEFNSKGSTFGNIWSDGNGCWDK